MKTRSCAFARLLGSRERTHLSRRERENRRTNRRFITVAALAFAVATGVVAYLAPDRYPIVTVYMQPDCKSCRGWMRYLESRGFRTQIGAESEWPAIRARFRLPPRFRGLHTAVVDGLLIEGHVPAGEIHAVLAKPDHAHIRGLVVPGLPNGAPGLPAMSTEPYVVYAMQDSGLMRPISTHERDMR